MPDYTEKSETESAAPVSDCRRPRAARGGAGLSYSAEGRGTVDETGVAHVYCANQRCEREGGDTRSGPRPAEPRKTQEDPQRPVQTQTDHLQTCPIVRPRQTSSRPVQTQTDHFVALPKSTYLQTRGRHIQTQTDHRQNGPRLQTFTDQRNTAQTQTDPQQTCTDPQQTCTDPDRPSADTAHHSVSVSDQHSAVPPRPPFPRQSQTGPYRRRRHGRTAGDTDQRPAPASPESPQRPSAGRPAARRRPTLITAPRPELEERMMAAAESSPM